MSLLNLGEQDLGREPNAEPIQAYDESDLFSASKLYTEKVVVTGAERRAIENLTYERNRRFEKLSGVFPEKAASEDPEFAQEAEELRLSGEISIDGPMVIGEISEKMFDLQNRYIEREIGRNPEKYKDVLSSEQIKQRVLKEAKAAYDNYVEVQRGAPETWTALAYDIGGTIPGQATDIVNLATSAAAMVFGGSTTVLKSAARGAVEGAVSESVQQYLGMDFQERAGIPEVAFKDRLKQVVGAGTIGAGFEAGEKIIGKAWNRIFGKAKGAAPAPTPKPIEKPIEGTDSGAPVAAKTPEKPVAPTKIKLDTEEIEVAPLDDNSPLAPQPRFEDSAGYDKLADIARIQGKFEESAVLRVNADKEAADAIDLSKYFPDYDPNIHKLAIKEVDDAIINGRPVDSTKLRVDPNLVRALPDDFGDELLTPHMARMKALSLILRESGEGVADQIAPPKGSALGGPQAASSQTRPLVDGPLDLDKKIDYVAKQRGEEGLSFNTGRYDQELADFDEVAKELGEDFILSDFSENGVSISDLRKNFKSERDFKEALTVCGVRV